MVRLVERGVPQEVVGRAAALRQTRIDRGEETVVGVNRYVSGEGPPADVLDVDGEAVSREQAGRLRALRDARDAGAVARALDRLAENAGRGRGGHLELAVEAMRARATVGEVSDALARAWGRHRARAGTVLGIYGGAYGADPAWRALREGVEAFEGRTGRRPRILVAKMGQDGHDRGARVVASAFSDAGFDVDLSPLFSTPEDIVKQAVENDVHVIGVSTQAGGHRRHLGRLLELLGEARAGDVAVVVGGIVPEKDREALRAKGVREFFGPGTPVVEAAGRVLGILPGREG